MNSPLTPEEMETYHKILFLITTRLDDLFTQGCLMGENSFNDERIKNSQDKIERLRGNVEKEKQRLQRLKGWLKHRNEVERLRNKK